MMTSDPESIPQSALEAVQHAVGPQFLWLRLDRDQTELAFADNLVFSQTTRGGIQTFVSPLAQSLAVPNEKAEELLHLTGFYQPGLRNIVDAGLAHLSTSISQVIETLTCHGRTLKTVILDEPTGPIPGLENVLQELWPTYSVVSLRSIGIASPRRMPLDGGEAEPVVFIEQVASEPLPTETYAPSYSPVAPVTETLEAPVYEAPVYDQAAPVYEEATPVYEAPIYEQAAEAVSPAFIPPAPLEPRVEPQRVETSLPVANGEEAVIPPAAVTETRARYRSSAPLRVLIAQEDASLASLLQLLLEREGFEVLLATDGRQAVNLLNQIDSASLVLLDLTLPYTSGVQLITHIRSRPEWDDVPIVVLAAANSQETEVVRAIDAGANDYVIKPISPEELMARLRRLMKFAAARR